MTRVLVAEDDRSVAKAITIRLAKEGLDVVCAHDTDSVVVKALQGLERPDLILMDIGLPGRGGIWAAKRIGQQQRGGRTPVIYVTANRTPGLREQALATQPADYIEKPYDSRSLVERILRLVG